MRHSGLALVGAALVATCLASTATKADDWPSRPVRIIAPATPGGAVDKLARLIAEPMSEKFHQRFYVENRPGAGGLIADAATAHADPDGYTLMMSSIAYHIVSPAMHPNSGIDPMRDFTHIAYVGGPPNVFIANPSLGVHSIKDLIALAKRSPQPLAIVSPGPGTMGHLLAEAFADEAGIKLQHIPHKGASQALMEILSGNVKLGTMTWSTALGQIKAGKVIALAVSSEERIPGFPDVPTLKELGYPNLVSRTWFGLSGPAKLPADIVQKLNKTVIEALARPEARKQLDLSAIVPIAMTPEQYTQYFVTEGAKWGPLAKRVAAEARK